MARANQTMQPHLSEVPGAGPAVPTSGYAELSADGVDPELLALPAPPRGRRVVTLTAMALVATLGLALVATLRADIAYYFVSATVSDVGDAVELEPAALTPNTFVQVHGTPMASSTVRYSRMIGSAEYAVFPLAGQRNVFVQVPLDGYELRSSSSRVFSGRLVTFGELGARYGAVRRHLADRMQMPVSAESFLLLADEPPSSYLWALGLAAMAALFVLLDLYLILRWFRPLPARLEPDWDGDEEPA